MCIIEHLRRNKTAISEHSRLAVALKPGCLRFLPTYQRSQVLKLWEFCHRPLWASGPHPLKVCNGLICATQIDRYVAPTSLLGAGGGRQQQANEKSIGYKSSQQRYAAYHQRPFTRLWDLHGNYLSSEIFSILIPADISPVVCPDVADRMHMWVAIHVPRMCNTSLRALRSVGNTAQYTHLNAGYVELGHARGHSGEMGAEDQRRIDGSE